MAGRSFNDLMQYPVFPFILANYDETTLDLESDSSYRYVANYKQLYVSETYCKEQCFLRKFNNIENLYSDLYNLRKIQTCNTVN